MDSYKVTAPKWELTVNLDTKTVCLTLLNADDADPGAYEVFDHDELVFLATHLANARHSVYVSPSPDSNGAPAPW